jgi:acetyl-CoA C-acetyltransferase
MGVDPRSPCLIGWSIASRFDGEPLGAWAEAARQALGAIDPAHVDSIDVVYCQSWPYDDPPARLAEAIGATPRRARYSGIGGTTPQVLLAEAAEQVLAGALDVALVVGGEQLDTVRRIKKAGERPAWSHRDPEKRPFPFEAPFHPAELAHQVFQAYTTFAMWDVARRAHVGAGPEAYRRSLGELFAPMTEVAARRDDAWFPQVRTVDELVEPTAENRMVAYPYTKRLVSVMDVDLSAAVVLASHEAADRLGVPADRRVYLRGSAYRTDPVHVAEHDEPWWSPGMAAAFDDALGAAGAGVDDVAHLDLYSCFPSSVSLALDALGLASGDRRAPFTVTGGLPYFGGAGSCYLVASTAALADVLVADPGSLGMATGVGMHLTKHVAGLWSTTPPATAAGILAGPDPGPAVTRPIVDVHHGPATVAAYTVHHGRDGAATDGLVVADVPGTGGARCYAVVRDPDLLAAMEATEWVGRTVDLVDGGDAVNLVAG